MAEPEPATPLSAERLAPLLAPLAGLGPAIAVVVEDGTGRVVASIGSADRAGGAGPVAFAAPIGSGEGAAGRIVVRGSLEGRDRGAVEAAIGVLSAGLTALAAAIDPHVLVERTRVEAELALGRRLQRSFVPLAAPEVPGWELASLYEPAREVGGDFFDLFQPRGRTGELALVIADVTGKGIAAALLMAFARPLIHAAIDHVRSPAAALERTNRILVQERRTALFITAQSVRLDIASGRFVLANAGHEPPIIARAAGGPLEEIEGAGVLLGAFAELGLVETRGVLGPGDLLLLYTDGVTDARAPSGKRFGDERLRSIVAAAAGAPAREVVDRIAEATAAFQEGEPAADDVTLVAVRRARPG